jgi:uncharacterized RmlC-like cupin family protein
MTGQHSVERWKHDGVRVIPGDQLDPNVPSTPGMDRKAAINFARAGAKKLWAGTVTIKPDAKTGAHHHGHLENIIYVVRRKARMRWGGYRDQSRYRAGGETGDGLVDRPDSSRSKRNQINFVQRQRPTAWILRALSADMANPPIDFRLLAGAGAAAREFKPRRRRLQPRRLGVGIVHYPERRSRAPSR